MELKISKNFTLEDIEKIREYNSKMTEGMTAEEKNNYYNKGAEKLLKEKEKSDRLKIEAYRKQLRKIISEYDNIYDKNFKEQFYKDVEAIIGKL